jgi:hypothetical protein
VGRGRRSDRRPVQAALSVCLLADNGAESRRGEISKNATGRSLLHFRSLAHFLSSHERGGGTPGRHTIDERDRFLSVLFTGSQLANGSEDIRTEVLDGYTARSGAEEMRHNNTENQLAR